MNFSDWMQRNFKANTLSGQISRALKYYPGQNDWQSVKTYLDPLDKSSATVLRREWKRYTDQMAGIKRSEARREAVGERAYAATVKARGGLYLKLVVPGQKGFPDRLVLEPGAVVYFIEWKKKGKNLEPMQELRKAELENLGFKVSVMDELGERD